MPAKNANRGPAEQQPLLNDMGSRGAPDSPSSTSLRPYGSPPLGRSRSTADGGKAGRKRAAAEARHCPPTYFGPE